MASSSISCTPEVSPVTNMPKYVHYKSLKVGLEFDYPGTWLFNEMTLSETDITILSLKDPRFKTLPTPWQEEPHPIPNDYGVIDIWVSPSTPVQTPDNELEALKSNYSRTSWMTVLGTYRTSIDGHDASVLEYEIYPTETEGGNPSVMFNRRIFFIANDKLYKLYFTVAEKDRGGEFEQGYEYFFNSLQIAP